MIRRLLSSERMVAKVIQFCYNEYISTANQNYAYLTLLHLIFN